MRRKSAYRRECEGCEYLRWTPKHGDPPFYTPFGYWCAFDTGEKVPWPIVLDENRKPYSSLCPLKRMEVEGEVAHFKGIDWRDKDERMNAYDELSPAAKDIIDEWMTASHRFEKHEKWRQEMKELGW